MNNMTERDSAELRAENNKISMLGDMLYGNVKAFCAGYGEAGANYPKNHNASKTALLNQITTLRNELLVLADKLKEC